jgi:hypothetical protein
MSPQASQAVVWRVVVGAVDRRARAAVLQGVVSEDSVAAPRPGCA